MMAAAAAVLALSAPNAQASSPINHAHPATTQLAAHATPLAVKATRSLQYAGVMMGDYEFYTQDRADTMMQRVRNLGLNTVRIYIKWDWVPSPRWYDSQAVCYAA